MPFAIDVEFDQNGGDVYPARCPHTYGYDANGRLTTDTITLGTTTWVKTYTYNASGQLTGESVWVKQ